MDGIYQLTRPDFDTIIDYCNDLAANEELEVFEFGKNCDLVLYIYIRTKNTTLKKIKIIPILLELAQHRTENGLMIQKTFM